MYRKPYSQKPTITQHWNKRGKLCSNAVLNRKLINFLLFFFISGRQKMAIFA